MSLSLKDKKILITGSTDGLGKLLAIELSKLGASIIIHGRNEDKVKSTLQGLSGNSHSSIVCDLNKPELVELAFSKINELDVLINNAGVWFEGATENMPSENIIEMVNVNLLSYLLVSINLIPKLKKSEFGQVLNVISMAGVEVTNSEPFYSVYSATKYALQGFTESIEKEFHNTNIRAMAFYSGGMHTSIFKKAGIEYNDREPWMFNPIESVESIIFMLTRNPKINIKRLDLINHLQK